MHASDRIADYMLVVYHGILPNGRLIHATLRQRCKSCRPLHFFVLWGSASNFCPAPLPEKRPVSLYCESPVFEVDLRRRPCRKNREVRRHVLSGRQPKFLVIFLMPRLETAR